MIKYFRFSYDQVLWEISYANLNMLLATTPDYSSKKEEKEIEVGSGKDLKSFLKM